MNDRHPSGTVTTPTPASDAASTTYASYGGQEASYGDFTTYGSADATGFHTGTHTTAHFATDPLFGDYPGDGNATGAYDTAHWTTGSHQTPAYDPYAAQHHAAYDTGAYDSTGWTSGYQHLASIPHQGGPVDATGQWDAGAWLRPDASGAAEDGTQQWDWGTQAFDTGAYDATQWNTDGDGSAATPGAYDEYEQRAEPFDQQATATFEQLTDSGPAGDYETDPYDAGHPDDDPAWTGEPPADAPLLEDQEEVTPLAASSSRAASRGAARSRRRPPARRSALLTVAVPSACVMGVAGIAAASVGTFTDDGKDTSAAASEAHAVQPSAANIKLDTQLQSLSAGADDFADRASRTQERIDLKAQQELEKKKAAEEAARKERLRPKFALPVEQQGLSAYYGQAGVNWMSLHTGIDFPVSYGTTVMAATDGTVRTQWNSAYGNMLILTAKDGTETWYCHLSSYRVPSGTQVKAGEPIAYSGNSGNSTGPHLHFEVRPGGGSAIDPLPWLRSHGLNPA
ncbi:M23 family metallopeptidase [Streptomyces sp. NPDC046831]|uniref:M23 family metallopeptidase n=1 Tax=Streptomyces sp. NPDC046831 TaxID=3154805 RepID=UPI0033DD54B9